MKVALRVLSRLFSYPDETLVEMRRKRSELERVLASEDERVASLISRFLEAIDPEKAAEEYIAVFEFPARCSLYAHTYILRGKEDMVGPFLLEVKSYYRLRGYDVDPRRELPDYLPAMLEFLSVIYDEDPDLAARFALRYIAGWVRRLKECLEKTGSPYSVLAEALEVLLERILQRSRRF
jgi:nitrate reductase delta subunit